MVSVSWTYGYLFIILLVVDVIMMSQWYFVCYW